MADFSRLWMCWAFWAPWNLVGFSTFLLEKKCTATGNERVHLVARNCFPPKLFRQHRTFVIIIHNCFLFFFHAHDRWSKGLNWSKEGCNNNQFFQCFTLGFGSDFHLQFGRSISLGCCGRPGDVTRSCCRRSINCFAETRKVKKNEQVSRLNSLRLMKNESADEPVANRLNRNFGFEWMMVYVTRFAFFEIPLGCFYITFLAKRFANFEVGLESWSSNRLSNEFFKLLHFTANFKMSHANFQGNMEGQCIESTSN